MRNTCHALVVLAIGAVQIAGCIRTGSGSGTPIFSPDGKQICYIVEDSIEESFVDGKPLWFSLSLHWCSTSEPAKTSSVHIDAVGIEYGYSTLFDEIKWSPNSSRIAVMTPNRLIVVDPNAGRKYEIHDGSIRSFAWQPDGQLVYSTRRTKGKNRRRVICRENVDTRQSTDIVAFPELPGEGGRRRDQWAPSGRFVIFMEPQVGGQYHCVDVTNGTVRSFGQTDAYDKGVAWTPDSSRAFCLSNKVGFDDIFEAFVFEPETGKIVDCTRAFVDMFADHSPSLEPLWTADGKYVIVNALDIRGHLIQPDPWQAVPLGQMLAAKLTAPTKLSAIKPRLFRLPVAGWVGVIPTGNYGDSPTLYAADYSGQRMVPLLKGYDRPISPDGTTTATISPGNKVTILTEWERWQPPADDGPK